MTIKYWFNFRPANFSPVNERIFFFFIIVLIILTLLLALAKARFKRNIYARLWQSSYNFFLTNAIIGLALTFFYYETVPFLSARFWLLVWAGSMIVWLFFIYKQVEGLVKKKALAEKEKEFKKYIP